MVLQIEDIIDSMIILHPDPNLPHSCKYDFFYPDHSSGQYKERFYGLSDIPSILNLGHGGSQRMMKNEILTENCKGIIHHDRRKKVGAKNSMVFQAT